MPVKSVGHSPGIISAKGRNRDGIRSRMPKNHFFKRRHDILIIDVIFDNSIQGTVFYTKGKRGLTNEASFFSKSWILCEELFNRTLLLPCMT